MIPIGILSSVTSSTSLLLDQYPNAAAAYSLRKLRTAYTGACIRVTNGSTSLDIGFVNNVLDLSTLQTFIGSGNGQVTTWYDQSGNSNNAIGLSDIIISGTLQTINTLPCLKINNTQFYTISTPIEANTNLGIFLTGKSTVGASVGLFLGSSGAPTVSFGVQLPPNDKFPFNALLNSVGGYLITTNTYYTSNYVILNGLINNSNYSVFQNNTSFSFTVAALTLSPTSYSFINRYFGSFGDAKYQELIFYKTDQTSNRTGIVNNTNSFYTIF
jgi:hypothetical protein